MGYTTLPLQNNLFFKLYENVLRVFFKNNNKFNLIISGIAVSAMDASRD